MHYFNLHFFLLYSVGYSPEKQTCVIHSGYNVSGAAGYWTLIAWHDASSLEAGVDAPRAAPFRE